MKRQALIISNPGEAGAQNYCNGVAIDVENYKSFLTSPLGGGWYQNEIIHLNRPTTIEMKNSISTLSLIDYSLIIFCGHGYFSSAKDATILELKKGEEFNSNDFRQGSIKKTIILDCCRQVVSDILTEKAMLTKFARADTNLNIAKSRVHYESEINACPKGIVFGYACSKNERAGDSHTRGGYYSYSLMKSAFNWYESNKVDPLDIYSTLSIVSAHNEAIKNVRVLSGNIQNPDIEKPKSEPYFPFAIKV